jgi:hypothetical protein
MMTEFHRTANYWLKGGRLKEKLEAEEEALKDY